MADYGRNRESIANLEETIYGAIQEHQHSYTNANEEPAVPIKYGLDIISELSRLFGEIMSPTELEQFEQLIQSNPDLELTPAVLVPLIAMITKANDQPASPQSSPNEDNVELPGRGRSDFASGSRSRSSSNESSGTAYHPSRPGSRATSRGPPQTPKGPSPFDTKNRQRSTPLQAPSSWSKPAPASRRKSIDGSRSDSESQSQYYGPSSYSSGPTPGRRRRAPSIPTSPTGEQSPDWDSSFSDSQAVSPKGHRYGHKPQSPGFSDDHNDDVTQDINSLAMPGGGGNDSDEDEDAALGLIMDSQGYDRRSILSSDASMDLESRLEALQKQTTNLQRLLDDKERSFQSKLQQHEVELYDLSGTLEEVRGELSTARKEEKELRAKERTQIHQISGLESDIAKLNKQLDNAKINYNNLQKQYQEQVSYSEKHREDMRSRDEVIRTLRETIDVMESESDKRGRDAQVYEERIATLERQLEVAQHHHAELEEQKQENLLLKETIDRLKFEMDEMRTLTSAPHIRGGSNSGRNSTPGSLSRTLGAELSRFHLGPDEEVNRSGDVASSGDEDTNDEDTEGEDVVQTIITRKKRKVASRAATSLEHYTFQETKEYSDVGIQYAPYDFFRSAGSQTLPPPKVISAQTQTLPPPAAKAVSMQTETEEPPLKVEMDIQTDPPVEESRPITPEPEASSSSSTALPPTPRVKEEPLPDDPPAYNQEQEERDWVVATDTLKKWHKGATIPMTPSLSGISADALIEWAALKKELGVDCLVIDKIIAESSKTGQPRDLTKRTKSRFYNIYNTYVYRGGKDGNNPWAVGPYLSTTIVAITASAATALIVSHLAQTSAIPGGPTPFDRPAWNSFNSMPSGSEGFTADGTAVVFNFLGRVTGGAARIARGWPT